MQTYIALLRGINVAGKNKMPMPALAATLQSAGCQSVRTYIQSGNAIFTHPSTSKPALTQQLQNAIAAQFTFRPHLLLLTDSDFRSALANNPFPYAIPHPKTLHFFFLDAKPASPNLTALTTLATASERFQLINTIFYLHTPDCFGRSTLAATAERKLGVPATARNYSTVQNLSAILDAL